MLLVLYAMSGLKPLQRGYRFYYTLHPRPTVLLVSKCPNGRVNIMPASWNMPVSEDPPTVTVAVDRETYTHKCLEYHGEATINIPPISEVDIIYALGRVSGERVDKASKYSVPLEDSRHVNVPRIANSLASLEVEVLDRLEVGEVTLFVFRVLETYVNPEYYTRWGWDFKKTNIPLHGAGSAFFKVGRMVKARK